MEYVKNECGDIKVQDERGNIKWLPQIIVENKIIMSGKGLAVSPAPVKFVELKKSAEPEVEPIVVIDSGTTLLTPEKKEEKPIVADVTPAKRGRKPTK